jgi:putative endonuclease
MKKEREWYVYLLECQDGTYYTGVTNDLDKRMKLHASGKGSKYVANKGYKKLLRAKPCESKSEAHKEEYYIKQLPRKEKLNHFTQ